MAALALAVAVVATQTAIPADAAYTASYSLWWASVAGMFTWVALDLQAGIVFALRREGHQMIVPYLEDVLGVRYGRDWERYSRQSAAHSSAVAAA